MSGSPSSSWTRRDFVTSALGGAAALLVHLRPASAARPGQSATNAAASPGKVVAREPFADVVELADKTWAILSNRESNLTISNGGIIAGDEGVLAIEGYMTPEGAAWASDLAEKLTGRRPTHVVVTHVHPDHTYGLAGYLGGRHRPQIIMTDATRRLFLERQLADESRTQRGKGLVAVGGPFVSPDAVIMPDVEPTTLDLGGRTVRLVERRGHTPSDLTIEIDSPNVIWTGDLVFHRMFPYYGDAEPNRLRETCRALLAEKATFVPGHGPCASGDELKPFLELLDHVEQAARASLEAGRSAADGAKDYKLPDSQKDLFIFSPQVFRFAFEAWYRVLRPAEESRKGG